MYARIFIASALAALFLFGCIPNLEKYPREKCTRIPTDNVVQALHDNCIKCHTKDFNTKQDICSRRGLIINAVATKKMPKIGKLWDSYFKTIVEWK